MALKQFTEYGQMRDWAFMGLWYNSFNKPLTLFMKKVKPVSEVIEALKINK